MTFFIITPALIVGAFVGRMKLSAMLFFVGIWSLFVYVFLAFSVFGRFEGVHGISFRSMRSTVQIPEAATHEVSTP